MDRLFEHQVAYKPTDTEIKEKIDILNRKKTKFDDKVLKTNGKTKEFLDIWRYVVGEEFSIQDYKNYILPYIDEKSFIDVIYPYTVDNQLDANECLINNNVYWVFEPNVELDFGEDGYIDGIYFKVLFTKDRVIIKSLHDKKSVEYKRETDYLYESEKMKRLQEKNYKQWLFHVGDFSKKSEDLVQLDCGRSTGYFGTGSYFCSEWEKCVAQGGGHRPLYALDSSRYNLMYGTLELHEALKDFNRYMSSYQLIIDSDNIDKDIWWTIVYYYDKLTYNGEYDLVEYLKQDYEWYIEKYPTDTFLDYIDFTYELKILIEKCSEVKELKDFVKWLNVESPNFEKVAKYQNSKWFDSELYNKVNDLKRNKRLLCIDLGVSENQFDKICEDIYYELEKYYEDGYLNRGKVPRGLDSIPTMFVKALGYDGIMANRDCDNISIGTCIYDIDSKDIVKLCDDVSEFNGDLSNLKEL